MVFGTTTFWPTIPYENRPLLFFLCLVKIAQFFLACGDDLGQIGTNVISPYSSPFSLIWKLSQKYGFFFFLHITTLIPK